MCVYVFVCGVCVCLCVFMCVFVCIYVFVYVCLCVYIYVCVHFCVCVVLQFSYAIGARQCVTRLVSLKAFNLLTHYLQVCLNG